MSANNDNNLGSSTFGDDPVSFTSKDDPEFSFEIVRPLLKLGRENRSRSKERKSRAAILTDTLEKDVLAEEQSQRKKIKVQKKKKNQVKEQISQSSNIKDKEYYCLACGEAYSESLSGEEWVQCHSCQGWAHAKCTSSAIFVCIICDSDND